MPSATIPIRGSASALTHLPTTRASLQSRNYAGLVAACVNLDSGKVFGGADEIRQRALRLQIVPLWIGLVALDIDADRRTRRSRSRQAEDDA